MQIEKPGHWLSLFRSFNPCFYPQIANQSFGRSLAYLLLLSFVLSSIIAVKYTVELSGFVPTFKEWVSAHSGQIWPKGLRELKVENGQVSSEVTQPFIYKWDDFVLVLDTSGEIKNLDGYSQGILILKDRVFFKADNSGAKKKAREYELPKSESFIIKEGDIEQGVIAQIINKGNKFDLTFGALKSLLKVFFIVLFLVNLFLFFIYYLNSKIAYALGLFIASFLINKIIKSNLKYNNLVNISIYALTPAAILALAVLLLKLPISGLWLIYPLLCVIYLIRGIRAVKDGGVGCLT